MNVDIVGMIYLDPEFLDFMVMGILKYGMSSKHNINYYIVANDATVDIKKKLLDDGIKHIIYNDPKPNDHYMNRVYRAWNFGGMQSMADVIVFINSDMAFSPGWLDNLLDKLDPTTIPCSRLIESERGIAALNCINREFGRYPHDFDESSFLEFSKLITQDIVKPNGAFMPCAFYAKDFRDSGGYPEGNIHDGGAGATDTPGPWISGDLYYFSKNPIMKNKNHITVFNSIVYHMIEGEKSIERDNSSK